MSKDKFEIGNVSDWSVEVTITPPTEIVEEDVSIDEYSIKNKELIRVEMNLIQFPIFSKNTKRKVNEIYSYYFNKKRDSYIKVTPQSGDYIPGETEEKVFIALMQIMKENGMKRKIIVTSTELRNKLKLKTTRYNEIIQKSLNRLSATNYIFKNAFYSSELKSVINKEISTTIFNITTISLEDKRNQEYRKHIEDKRIKTIYEIEFSEHFYNNVIQKGYIVYNGNTLLEIDSSVARTIYMLIEKLRFYKTYIKIDIIYFIKRIPLKDDKKNISRTVNIIKKALEELKEKKLVKNFEFIKETTWEKAEVEIYFSESLSKNKQQRFYDDRNEIEKIKKFSEFTVSETENEFLEESKKEIKKIKKEEIEEIVPIENIVDEKLEKSRFFFENLAVLEKEKIETVVKEDYFKKCGGNSKIQELAFKAGKNKLILDYIIENNLYEVKEQPKEQPKESESTVEELKKYLENSISVTCSLIGLSETESNKLKINIYKEIRPLLVKKTLTIEELDKIINKHTDELITF